MIYLDNASTSLRKPRYVLRKIKYALNHYEANPGRSGHYQSIKTGLEVLKCREIIAKHFNTTPNNVVFTSGCTEALNLSIRGTLQKGGHIITTAYEHNSVLRVLEHLKNNNLITYTIIYPDRHTNKFNIKDFENAIKQNTYMIICNHISNVIGYEQNIYELGNLCKQYNLSFIVDTAQSGGHKRIDMVKNNISILAFAGHKGFMGLQGVGGICINNCIVNPIKFGGTGTNSESLIQPTEPPEGLESGTLPTINILSLKAGIEYVEKHFEKIQHKIAILSKYTLDKLSQIKGIKILTSLKSTNGVISFISNKLSPQEIANILDNEYKICVRNGLCCAPLINKYFNTLENGVIRVSLSHFNNKMEINKLINALIKMHN